MIPNHIERQIYLIPFCPFYNSIITNLVNYGLLLLIDIFKPGLDEICAKSISSKSWKDEFWEVIFASWLVLSNTYSDVVKLICTCNSWKIKQKLLKINNHAKKELLINILHNNKSYLCSICIHLSKLINILKIILLKLCMVKTFKDKTSSFLSDW